MQTDKTQTFTALRPLLYSLAYQMLGSNADAEDMMQECFLRWDATEAEQVRSPKAYLTTIMTRLCLKHLQSFRVQREQSFGSALPESMQPDQVFDPTDHARLAESLSGALVVILRTLSPVERVVFLLREVFDCDYQEISPMVDKTEENCRQILRRARERIASRRPRYNVMPQHEERTLQRFLQASANGKWQELMEVLTTDTTLDCDGGDLDQPGSVSVRGAQAVSEFILKRASAWLPADALLQTVLLYGCPVVVTYRNGIPINAIFASVVNDRIKALSIITCPVRLRSLLIQPDSVASHPVS